MDFFWDAIIGPIIMMLRPKTIVEIGSEQGITTRLILGYCRCFGGVLHAVDPCPCFDVNAWKKEYGEHFELHQTLSLKALPVLGPFDLIFLDGDHNWYTVFNELKWIEKRARDLAQPFPLVLFHDISWPYGRRDLYYNPDTIPPEHRQPYARKGMLPGISELREDGGLNAGLHNAVHEHGPRNGVLTAIEDFLKESSQPLEFFPVPGNHGLGVLYPPKLAEQHPELGKLLKTLTPSPFLERFLNQMETNRLNMLMSLSQYKHTLVTVDAIWKAKFDESQMKLEATVKELEAQASELARLRQQ